MDDLLWSSATDQRTMLDARSISAAELHTAVVESIERHDATLHAVVIPLFDRPASGVPMLLKDAGQELAGTPHWVGVAALRDAGSRSSTTTDLARRFEANGFSIIGKGACPQLSTGATTEPAGFAPTVNPWDPTRSAGGSSGGPAAAVASGMVPVAHGSDATGSLRAPAALCGVATLCPTAGRIVGVPPAGQPPNAAWRDFVLARHAADLSLVFGLLTGAPPLLPGRLRVGLLDHDPELGLPVHPACAEGVHVAGRLLESLGHTVDVGWPAPLDHLWAAASAHFQVVSDATRPPVIGWVSNRLGRPVERGELEDAVFDAAERAAARSAESVALAADAIDTAIAPIHDWWSDFDVLVTPTTFQPAWPLGVSAGPKEMGTLLAPFSLSGQPALSLPVHHTEDGMPVGAQMVGRRGTDEMLLGLAEQIQSAHDWTVRRPPLP